MKVGFLSQEAILIHMYDLQFLQQDTFIIPAKFSRYRKDILAHRKEMLKSDWTYCHTTLNTRS